MTAMLHDPKRQERIDGLEARLRRAHRVTPELMSEVLAEACPRFAAAGAVARAKVNKLIDSAAWMDAAVAVLEIELPQWKLRRAVYEDGEWLCSLSREPWLPLCLDDLVETSHAVLPLAILAALVEARHATTVRGGKPATVPRVSRVSASAMCCDNFS
jgi:hypothetical protein